MPPQQQQQGGDNSLAPLWITAAVFVAVWIIWTVAHEQIAWFILHFKLWEAKFISLFDQNAWRELALINSTSPSGASFQKLNEISADVGKYFRYPLAIILGGLAVAIYFTNPTLNYKKTYDMKKLVAQEKDIWPQITPVANLNLVEADLDEGVWAMAASPMQFAKKNNLLLLERIIPTEGLAPQAKIIANLKQEDAYRVFTLQLGRYWRGADQLNIHTKALFAAFAARANRDTEGAAKLLLHIANSSKNGKLDFNGVEELLKKHKDNKAVIKLTKSHAFVLTVMASMLKLARTDGVMASADFLWLKPIDRSLWFMLNSVGRQTPFTENAGAFAHWLAEVKLGRKLFVPMVAEAVTALDLALKDIIYIPDQNEEVEIEDDGVWK